jgi:hypothetical protein
MEFEVTSIGAAVDQLDWSIRLFLDHRAYVPAITLAGAAEEILGKAVGKQAAFETLKATLFERFALPEKVVVKDHLNRAKNFLKHGNTTTAKEIVILDSENEAIQYIVRALVNLVTHDCSLPSEFPRFWAWVEKNQPGLLCKTIIRMELEP